MGQGRGRGGRKRTGREGGRVRERRGRGLAVEIKRWNNVIFLANVQRKISRDRAAMRRRHVLMS